MPSRLSAAADSSGADRCKGLISFPKRSRRGAPDGDGRGDGRAVGFFAFVIMRVTTPPMGTLFTDLSVEDSSAILKDLERQAIPYELRNDGATILVPQGQGARGCA